MKFCTTFEKILKICDIKFYNSFETNFAKSEKAFIKEEFVKTFLRRLSHNFVAYEFIKTLLRKLFYDFIRVIKRVLKSDSEIKSDKSDCEH